MRQTLAHHGDPIEREYSEFLDARLPSYGILWSHFVGNNGKSEVIPLSLSEEHQALRHEVNQFTYSAIESAIVAQRCQAKVSTFVESYSQKHHLSGNEYLDLSELLFSYYAHLGRIRDLIEKLGAAIDLPGLAHDLDEYYKQRNNILHEARVPMMLTGDAIGIVPPEGLIGSGRQWGKKKLWATKDDLDMHDVASLVAETTDAMLVRLETALARAHSQLMSGPLRVVADALDRLPGQANVSFLPSGSIHADTSFDGFDIKNVRFELIDPQDKNG